MVLYWYILVNTVPRMLQLDLGQVKMDRDKSSPVQNQFWTCTISGNVILYCIVNNDYITWVTYGNYGRLDFRLHNTCWQSTHHKGFTIASDRLVMWPIDLQKIQSVDSCRGSATFWKVLWPFLLTVWVSRGSTSHWTLYRLFRGRFLQVRWPNWPNQQCQSTEES